MKGEFDLDILADISFASLSHRCMLQACSECGFVLPAQRPRPKTCSACGDSQNRTFYPDAVSISLLRNLAHHYNAGLKSQTEVWTAVQQHVSRARRKSVSLNSLKEVRKQLLRMSRRSRGDRWQRMVTHVTNTFPGADDPEEICSILVFFRDVEPDFAATILVACAYLESLLHDLLVQIRCRRMQVSKAVAEAYVQKKEGGLRSRQQLFEAMVGEDLSSALDHLGYSEWNRQWVNLSKRRNDVLHKAETHILLEDARAAMKVVLKASSAIGSARNRALRLQEGKKET